MEQISESSSVIDQQPWIQIVHIINFEHLHNFEQLDFLKAQMHPNTKWLHQQLRMHMFISLFFPLSLQLVSSLLPFLIFQFEKKKNKKKTTTIDFGHFRWNTEVWAEILDFFWNSLKSGTKTFEHHLFSVEWPKRNFLAIPAQTKQKWQLWS